MSLSERLNAGAPRERMITDEEADRALHWLVNNAKTLGDAKARLVKAERMIGIVEAIETKDSDATSDTKKKADARASYRYLAAVNEEAYAAGEYETLRALRAAAEMKLEAWRSETATLRSIKM